MLINAQTPEELRLAIISNSTLDTYQVEAAEGGLTRGNIYRGIITNIQPSLNAAFIDYGAERNGFLAIQDVVEDAWYRQPKKGGRPKIEEVLDRGKPIVVQVTREPEGQKGAALTTNLSLAGRYLVLTPFEDTRGVSRKVESDEDRKRLKQLASQLKVPKGCGVIVRTNALDQTKTTLNRDLAALLRLWKQVKEEARKGKSTRLLYSDQDLILQALRDYLDSSIEEVLVDNDQAYEKAQEYLRAFLPRGKTELIRYQERTPLFSKFNLEPQIDRIYDRRMELPSGGSIVIDRTEALTAIDVNSGRSTGRASQEDTAVHTNLEAAQEVARQLRLRDIGGLLVVDFIDMRSPKNRRKVEKKLREAMKDDKARSRVGRISANGLLEINRQRIHQALSMRTHRPCPTCEGTGRIASPEMVGLSLLRRIEARAATGTLQRVRIALHPELADAFQNARRQEIAALEQEFDIKVEVVAASHLHRPEQEVDWFSRSRSASRPAAETTARDKASVRVTDVTPEKRRAQEAKAREAPTTDEKAKKPSKKTAKKAAKKAKKKQPEKKEEKPEERKRPRRRTRRRKSAQAKETPKETREETRKETRAATSAQKPEDQPADQPTGRRRRRRRKSRSTASRGQAAKATESPKAQGEEAKEAKETEARPGAKDEKNGGSSTRRRSRRRGQGKDTSKAPQRPADRERKENDDKPTEETKGEEQTKGEESSGRRRPRRRRSRRRKDAEATAGS